MVTAIVVLSVLGVSQAAADTILIRPAAHPPVFDGKVDTAEWGPPTLEIKKDGAPVRIWLRRWEDAVYLAADLPDSTFYWGDDLVISLDTRGDRASSPQHDDFQWYFRRVLDSSVVFRGNAGSWLAPLGDPDWRLGRSREGGGWEVRSASSRAGWSLELKLVLDWFAGEAGRRPGMGLRTYDDGPNRWYIWPESRELKQPTQLERIPARWAAVVIR